MKNTLPTALETEVDNTFAVDLTFRSMDDFSPDRVAAQVPRLAKLLNMRKHLTALAGLDQPKDAKRHLAELLQNEPLLAQFAETPRSGSGASCSNSVKAIHSLLAGIDAVLSKQMNEILHAPEVTQVEGTWRGLWYLVSNTATDRVLKIRVMHITKAELADTLEKFEGRMWDQSPIYKRIYSDGFSTFRGEPFAAIIGAYEFGHHSRDVGVLRGMSSICAAAHAPFIAAADPGLFNMETWQELPNPWDLEMIAAQPSYAAWQSLRESEDSRYIGLTLPRVLARRPCGPETGPVKGFGFIEAIDQPPDSFVWMNAAFTMGVNINRSHRLSGWGAQIRGVDKGGLLTGLPVHRFPTDDGSAAIECPTEIAIDDRREAELAKLGLMPILYHKGTDLAAFVGAHSLQDDAARAAKMVDPDAQANERLSANLAHLFAVSRFAQYLLAIARDKIGTFQEPGDLEQWLSEWINRYVLANPVMADDIEKAKRPLAKASVKVANFPVRPDHYPAQFHLCPHDQMDRFDAALRVVFELPFKKQG